VVGSHKRKGLLKMTQIIAVIMATNVIKASAVEKMIAPLQRQFDNDFYPAWKDNGVVPVEYQFYPNVAEFNKADIPDEEVWPIFINRHSDDEGALGWHTKEGKKIYGRVFAGDCIRYGLEVSTDLGHEALEVAADPPADLFYRMRDGELAALEVCDAVESDACAYEDKSGVKMSNFVLPSYFSARRKGPYDFRGALTKACPELTPGGYMSVTKNGQWTQVTRDRRDGMRGRRSLMNGYRRRMRFVDISKMVVRETGLVV
jgi:hypothetical protein